MTEPGAVTSGASPASNVLPVTFQGAAPQKPQQNRLLATEGGVTQYALTLADAREYVDSLPDDQLGAAYRFGQYVRDLINTRWHNQS